MRPTTRQALPVRDASPIPIERRPRGRPRGRAVDRPLGEADGPLLEIDRPGLAEAIAAGPGPSR